MLLFFQKLKSAAQRGWTSLPAWFGRIVISKIWRLLSWIFPSTNCAVWPQRAASLQLDYDNDTKRNYWLDLVSRKWLMLSPAQHR